MVDNHPSVRAKPEGKGVVIDHKFHGYVGSGEGEYGGQ